jgi:hypothetical protein
VGWRPIDTLFAEVEERQGEIFMGTLIGTSLDGDKTPWYGHRKCVDCGKDIRDRGSAAKRCLECARPHDLAVQRECMRQRRAV